MRKTPSDRIKMERKWLKNMAEILFCRAPKRHIGDIVIDIGFILEDESSSYVWGIRESGTCIMRGADLEEFADIYKEMKFMAVYRLDPETGEWESVP